MVSEVRQAVQAAPETSRWWVRADTCVVRFGPIAGYEAVMVNGG
jgi:hypothetical protein